MATPETDTPKASKAPTSKDDRLVADLSPENRVAFRQANLARVQAEAALEEAKRAAEIERGKPLRCYGAAKKAYDAAVDKRDGAVEDAQGVLNSLLHEAGNKKADSLIKLDRPDEGKKQVADLQGLLDKYKAKVANVAVQMQLVDEASLALQKLSKPQGVEFNPMKAEPDPTAQLIADEQYNLAIAQAQIPFDAAMDAFDLKEAELRGSKPRSVQ